MDPHTLERAAERGASASEIRDVLDNGVEVHGKHGRKGKARVYHYGHFRGGRACPHKRVVVYYAEEADTLVTVTVYVFYGHWGNEHEDRVQRQD